MTLDVYINRTAHFLPNQKVDNSEMEEFLGLINNTKSKSKAIVLRNNKIEGRYYAITKEGKVTHTNAEMTSLAIKNLFNNVSELREVDLICCGTSTPEQLMPSHGVMVHGFLPETKAIEVVSPSGVCCAGMHALKYAYMSVKTGMKNKAVSTGSERLSRVLRSDQFEEEVQKLIDLEQNPFISFEKDFLRWMLSDGAGAFLIENKPNKNDISLKIEWIDGISFANQEEACMYMGSEKLDNGNLKSYMDYSPTEIFEQSILSIKQDVKLLSEKIVPLGFVKLKELLEEKNITVDDIDYFLPHLSSFFFESKIADFLDQQNMSIPKEKWFTNLKTKGNVGAGSIYLMLDELFTSGRLKKGEKILLVVPESSRFSYMYCLLSVC